MGRCRARFIPFTPAGAKYNGMERTVAGAYPAAARPRQRSQPAPSSSMPRTCTPTTSPDAAPSASRRTRARLGVAMILLAVLAGLVLCRRALLTAAAGLLAVDQPSDGCDFVLVESGDRCYDLAAELIRENPARRILLLAVRPGRLQQFGVLPRPEEQARRTLEKLGVPASLIEVIPCLAGDSEYPSDRLGAWMVDHPEARVVVLCDRLGSRSRRLGLDSRLPPEQAARIAIHALPNARGDVHNWWHSRSGVKEFVTQALVLAYTAGRGEEPECRPEWDPIAYEQSLRSGGEAP